MNLLCANSTIGHLDCGLDHGEGEPFDAIPEELQIPHLGFVESTVDRYDVLKGDKQAFELLLGYGVERLIVPQCIVGIECDGGDHRNRELRTENRETFNLQPSTFNLQPLP
jgi:hypothetical protein